MNMELNNAEVYHEQIPCRTAMRGSFPLNGTYFQVNEVDNCALCLWPMIMVGQYSLIQFPCRCSPTTRQVLSPLMFLGLGYGTYRGELFTLEPPYQQYSGVNIINNNRFHFLLLRKEKQ